MVWWEKTLWFSSLLTNRWAENYVTGPSQCLLQCLLQSVTVLPKFLQTGCYKDSKKIIVLGVAEQGLTSEVCNGEGGNIILLEQGTDQRGQLGQGNGVGSHSCLAGASSSCSSIGFSLGCLCTVSLFAHDHQCPWFLALQDKLSPPSTFNLFLVLQIPQNFSFLSVLWISLWSV